MTGAGEAEEEAIATPDGPRPPRRGRLRRWIEDRTGAAAIARFIGEQGAKLVPARLSWVYSTGTLALFFFALQAATGSLMLLYYVPDEKLAHASVQTIEHRVALGWLVRQMHAWGSNFIVVILILHVLKVLWYGAYKRPREFTWFAGAVLLALTLGFCLSGYLLPWNQLSFWATRVAVGAVDSIPFLGESLKEFICGGPDVSGRTLGRFFALHVVILPAVLLLFLAAHLALVIKHGITPRVTVPEEEALGHDRAVALHGAESFFPRQVYKELFILNLAFALLVTFSAYFPWEVGEPASLETPEGIKPEWYFLPPYQFLKYFDDGLYAAVPGLEAASRSLGLTPEFLGVLAMGAAGLVFFILPLIDRSSERRISRRPIFAALAFLALLGVLGLGVLGYVSGRTVTLAGKTYRFTAKGYPVVVETGTEGGAGTGTGTAAGTAAGTGTETAAATAAGAAAPSHRSDGLPPGGTCGNADCHAEEHEEWKESVHDLAQVECRVCHGGIDTAPPPGLPEGLDAAGYAHLGVARKRSGEPRRPARGEVAALCGACHESVLSVFSPLHFEKKPEESPQKTCVNCHANHAIKEPGEWLYEKGYADPADPRTKPFLAARDEFASVAREIAAAETLRESLGKSGYPVEELREAIAAAGKKLAESRPLVHALDEAALTKRTAPIREDLSAVRAEAERPLAAKDERWKLVAGVWAGVVFLNALLWRKLRSLPKAGRGEDGGEALPQRPR